MIVDKIVREVVEEFIKKDIINEYLDKDYGMPLYNTAKKELDSVNVVKTTWLVHCAWDDESAESMMRNGFTNGVSKEELGYNALTNSLKAKRSDRGYAWAYEVKDVLMGDCTHAGKATSILFQASGVEYYNDWDEEMQVIFDNKTPKNMILVYEWDGFENKKDVFKRYVDGFDDSMPEDKLFGVGNINGKPLYVGKFNDVLKWCVTNFQQYKKYLLSNKDVLHANIDNDKFQSDFEDYLDKKGYGELPKDAINKYNKWHSWDEEKDDLDNWNSILNTAYEEYLAQNWDENASRNWIINTYKEQGRSVPDDETIDRILDVLKPSYGDFLDKHQKEYSFYHRRRPDGCYWRK